MSHYYDREQVSPLRESEVIVDINNRKYSFITGSGTFSRRKLDNASELLITSCEVNEGEEVLDLGCGWGAVGILVKLFHKNISLTMVDNNRRSILITRKNLSRHGIDAKTKISNIFENIPDSRFDVILTNPPYAAGRSVCYSFIEQSYEHLKENGSLQLVARHQKGGAMLEKHMKEIFGNVTTLSKKGGFRVYKSVKT